MEAARKGWEEGMVMARGRWGQNGRYSYKRTTLILCSVNIVVAMYVLRSLYSYPLSLHQSTLSYTANQVRKMEESNQIRKASEPTKLIELVTQLKIKFKSEESSVELPRRLKQKLVHEILDRLRSLSSDGNATEQREAINAWHREKMKEAKKIIQGKPINTTILPKEAGAVKRVLSSGWSKLSEAIGLWIPFDIVNKEHDDKPEGEEDDGINLAWHSFLKNEFCYFLVCHYFINIGFLFLEYDILPGKKLPPECHAELHTDYDGIAVRWGLTHHQESAYDCCMACLNEAKHAKPGEKRCNIWVYCPTETGCYSPDIYEHKNQECWLKYSGKPKLNFKDKYSEAYRDAHPNAPAVVPWVSGIINT